MISYMAWPGNIAQVSAGADGQHSTPLDMMLYCQIYPRIIFYK